MVVIVSGVWQGEWREVEIEGYARTIEGGESRDVASFVVDVVVG